MENEIDNELIVVDDVPETLSEENEQIETSASDGVEEVQETTQEVDAEAEYEKRVEERAHQLMEEQIEARLVRDRISRERKEAPQRAKYQELENIMKTALGAENLDDVLTKSKEFYKQQGIVIPEIVSKPSYSERDEIVLAKADAGDIIKLGKTEMESEANRIAAIPEKDRSIREKTIFQEVCSRLIQMKDEDSLKQKGYDLEILKDQEFTKFRNQFTFNTPVSQIVEMYQKVNGNKPIQPKSPGSARTTNTSNEIKEYYSPEEARKFTEEELENPKLMAALEKSMQLWAKNK